MHAQSSKIRNVLILCSRCEMFFFFLAVPVKDEDEVVEEMETSSSLEEDSIPVISRCKSCVKDTQ